MKQYLAIDIGGTSVKLGIVDEEGRVLAKAEQSVCFDYYETPILTTVLSASEQFLKEQDVRPQSLAGIGVSATGQIDTHTGTVVGTCGSLPNYIGSPIKAELEAKFGLPVTVANDANCMTLGRRGERLYGRHRCHAGHRRGRRHPDRRTAVGRCPGPRR